MRYPRFGSGRPVLRIGAALVAMTMLIAACGNGGGAGGGDGDGAGGDTIVYWSMWEQGEPQQQVIQEALDAYSEETGVEFEVQWAGREVMSQVVSRLNSGEPPDLTDQEGGEIGGALAEADAARGLGGLYEATIDGEDQTVGDVIPEPYIEPYRTEDGEPFIAPYEVIGSTLWFNAQEHADLADDPPADWDEFVSLLDEMQAEDGPPLALDGDISFYLTYWYTWAAIRHGGPGILKEAAQDETGETWEDPALLAAAEDIHELVEGGHFVEGFRDTQWPAQQNAWATGESSAQLLLMGSWAPSETAEQAGEDFEYRSMRYPEVEGGAGNDAAEAGVIGFAIPDAAENPEGAEDFIAYFLNRDRLEPIASETLNLTPREDIDVPDQLADLQEQIHTAVEQDAIFEPYDGVDAEAPDWNNNVYEEVVAELFAGQLDPQEFVDEMRDRTASLHGQ